MAASYTDYVHPYLLSATSPDRRADGLDEFITASRGFRWNRSRPLTVPTPGTAVVSLPPVVIGLPLAVAVSYIFDEPVNAGRDICELHRDSKLIKQSTRFRKGCVVVEVAKPTFKSSLAGGPTFVLRFWHFFCFIFDIGTEFIANAFITGEYWPSTTDEQAIRILTRMATDIPKFQSFYKEYTKGPLFEYMMFQGPRGAPESVWNFTREGIRTSFIASYVVSQLASFLELREKRVFVACDNAAANEVLTLPTCHFTPKNLANSWTPCGAISDYATAVLDYITPLSDDPDNIYEARRISYYQSETLIQVTHALLDDFELLPVAHALLRTFGKHSLPSSILAFAAAIVQRRLGIMRDLPITGGKEFIDEDAFPSEEFLEIWGSNKDKIIAIERSEVASGDSAANQSTTPLASTSARNLKSVFQSLSPSLARVDGKAALRTTISAIESDFRLTTVISGVAHANKFLEDLMQYV